MNLSPLLRRILPSDKTIVEQPAPATAATPVDEESGTLGHQSRATAWAEARSKAELDSSHLTIWRAALERGELAVIPRDDERLRHGRDGRFLMSTEEHWIHLRIHNGGPSGGNRRCRHVKVGSHDDR